MAINKNHEFEELDGIKCAIVQKQATAGRVAFVQALLQHNGYQVVVIPSPPPKAAPPKEGEEAVPVAAPATFTIGVTDVTFNATNAIFGRLLRTTDGKVVTLGYWKQETDTSRDDIPYFDQITS
jgi:hypothetical protein